MCVGAFGPGLRDFRAGLEARENEFANLIRLQRLKRKFAIPMTLGFALVDATGGGVIESNSKNVTDANVSQPGTGIYCFDTLSFTPKAAQATVRRPGNGASAFSTPSRNSG